MAFARIYNLFPASHWNSMHPDFVKACYLTPLSHDFLNQCKLDKGTHVTPSAQHSKHVKCLLLHIAPVTTIWRTVSI